ncbi:MAG: Peptide chain release factor 1 [Candidatus Beckwithbacteria bacterium GW2011_GWB1_47_15]|uniref:Peptide chain release factor 1 n=1 Tax=Candidatus Beckwithbacteria bacterium GW2011_GWB1_47_15 TaxID=1618371 RepID=A0A0G1RWB3_9BACT|nr:MAG: peptide chain release factor 1, peptide chain release factor 1 [Candidatus Beckwithbacteria bacterium GW2011_GWC1_49_16]KKU35321.1 MAG: Peptide chain release factor 1 [Candidatus Beckwithbacteria bacterium GW2011_GWA1_46_30]KKU61416.1 MAG: Peptide chain release factor 1 [Candidatus Beckwithbacteria bacterium GW2011_GWB1_47_15]KKU71823.1 MAG: Peptide chain release factor 1 [Candidatus Beckwithbacteria bacterium GW2011_GWA2_47_25]KKW03717.1 MAG: Peptide chain release factor 1 [Candidatus 
MTDYLKQEIDRLDQKIAAVKKSLADRELAPLAEEELAKLQAQKQVLLAAEQTPQINQEDSIDSTTRSGNVIIEIRPGTGGEEAKIWAADLEDMYTRFANSQGLAVVKLDQGIIKIKGKQTATLFQFEAGVHRVQRIPETEAHGRLHTSTATVAVLPEISEKEVVIHPGDLTIQFTHASSQGGQNVQKVSTAVRITHKPTGIITSCQTQRFQEQNRKIALDLLRSKLYQRELQKIAAQKSAARAIIGRGMRAEKIRTYNFPQNRVTDHRIAKSWKALDKIIAGDLEPVVSTLTRQLPPASPSA